MNRTNLVRHSVAEVLKCFPRTCLCLNLVWSGTGTPKQKSIFFISCVFVVFLFLYTLLVEFFPFLLQLVSSLLLLALCLHLMKRKYFGVAFLLLHFFVPYNLFLKCVLEEERKKTIIKKRLEKSEF